jgi:hypothetical protein
MMQDSVKLALCKEIAFVAKFILRTSFIAVNAALNPPTKYPFPSSATAPAPTNTKPKLLDTVVHASLAKLSIIIPELVEDAAVPDTPKVA